MGEISRRRLETTSRLEDLRVRLSDAQQHSQGKACVYVTGSFGRHEASQHSDLDLFIVGKVDDKGKRLLRKLDEICIKADLIELTRALKIPEFSGDGRYLDHYSVLELTKTLGTPEDDVANTFTARLLLLLESRPLLEAGVYTDIIQEVVAAYWGDYEDHKSNFMPAFLANDILRLWRTFCVNYEARSLRVPDQEKAKRKLKNYKLKHSRLLTCYSALLYLLAVFTVRETVSPADAVEMIQLTPTERLEWLLLQDFAAPASGTIKELLAQYEEFLSVTNAKEDQLIERFLDKGTSTRLINAANVFGDSIFKLLTSLGQGSRFHRLLVV